MRVHDMFDTAEGQGHRMLILGQLNELMMKWILQVSMEKVSPGRNVGFVSREEIGLSRVKKKGSSGI